MYPTTESSLLIPCWSPDPENEMLMHCNYERCAFFLLPIAAVHGGHIPPPHLTQIHIKNHVSAAQIEINLTKEHFLS